MHMGKLSAHLVDVKGAFWGEFKPDEKINMKIPWGFEKFYPCGGLLFLKRILYMELKMQQKHFGDWI